MSTASSSSYLWTGLLIFLATATYLFRFAPTSAPDTLSPELSMLSKVAIDVLTADIKTLQHWLQHGHGTSATLVELYLSQIHKHDGYLHAMIQTRSLDLLLETARTLDQERQAGNLRGPLHGIPIIIKVWLSSSFTSSDSHATYRTTLQHVPALAWELPLEAWPCSALSRPKMLRLLIWLVIMLLSLPRGC